MLHYIVLYYSVLYHIMLYTIISYLMRAGAGEVLSTVINAAVKAGDPSGARG